MTLASVYGPADAGARRIRCWALVRALLASACAVVVTSFSEWVALNSLTVGLVMMVFAHAKSRVAAAMMFLAMLAATLWSVRVPEALYEYLLDWGRPGVEHEQWSVALVGLSFTAALSIVFIIVRGLGAARVTPDPTGRHLVIGIVAGFTFQAAFCVCSVVMSPWGLVPAGLAPLHLSFTGSSLVATLMGLGLILNVRMRGRASGSPTGPGSPMVDD